MLIIIIIYSLPSFILICKITLTSFMEQSPSWETHSLSANHEISRLLWNLKVAHKNTPLIRIVNIINPVNIVEIYFITVSFNIILQSTPRSPSGLFHSSFPTKILYAFFISPMLATLKYHNILLLLLVVVVVVVVVVILLLLLVKMRIEFSFFNIIKI
jgi:hypothetical protein